MDDLVKRLRDCTADGLLPVQVILVRHEAADAIERLSADKKAQIADRIRLQNRINELEEQLAYKNDCIAALESGQPSLMTNTPPKSWEALYIEAQKELDAIRSGQPVEVRGLKCCLVPKVFPCSDYADMGACDDECKCFKLHKQWLTASAQDAQEDKT